MLSKSSCVLLSCRSVAVVLVVYTLIAVISNLMVLRVIWKRCRRFYCLIFHYMILASMAGSNIVTALSVLAGFFAVRLGQDSEDYGNDIARTFTVFILSSLIIPVLNACMLAVNRYILCNAGLRYRNIISRRKMILSIIGIWVLSYAAFAVDQAADPKRLDNLLLVSSTSTTVLWVVLSLAAIVLIFVSHARTFFLVKNKIFKQPHGSRLGFRAENSIQMEPSSSGQAQPNVLRVAFHAPDSVEIQPSPFAKAQPDGSSLASRAPDSVEIQPSPFAKTQPDGSSLASRAPDSVEIQASLFAKAQPGGSNLASRAPDSAEIEPSSSGQAQSGSLRVAFHAPNTVQIQPSPLKTQSDNLLLVKRCIKLTSGTVLICLWYSVTMVPFITAVALARIDGLVSRASMDRIQRLCSYILFVQELIDPVIYCLSTKEIRKCFKKELKCLKERLLHCFTSEQPPVSRAISRKTPQVRIALQTVS